MPNSTTIPPEVYTEVYETEGDIYEAAIDIAIDKNFIGLDSFVFDENPTPDSKATKVIAPEEGETVSFELVVTNHGTVDAHQVQITDYLDDRLVLDSILIDGEVPLVNNGSDQNLDFTISLAAGATRTILVNTLVDFDDADELQSLAFSTTFGNNNADLPEYQDQTVSGAFYISNTDFEKQADSTIITFNPFLEVSNTATAKLLDEGIRDSDRSNNSDTDDFSFLRLSLDGTLSDGETPITIASLGSIEFDLDPQVETSPPPTQTDRSNTRVRNSSNFLNSEEGDIGAAELALFFNLSGQDLSAFEQATGDKAFEEFVRLIDAGTYDSSLFSQENPKKPGEISSIELTRLLDVGDSQSVDATQSLEVNSAEVISSDGAIVGTPEPDRLVGTAASELIQGLGERDALFGLEGNDTLEGGPDNDGLTGGPDADTLDGGLGTDFASYQQSDAAVVINLSLGTGFGGDAEGDTLNDVETLVGSDFDDQLTGDANRNGLYGNDGNDMLSGEAGNDGLIGGAGADTLNGGAGNDLASYGHSDAGVNVNLTNGVGRGGHAEGDILISIERLTGSNFNDRLTGDSKRNTLVGGAGADILLGGDSRDIFTYRSLDESLLGSHDVIGDLSIGIDRINGPTAVAAEDLAQLGSAASLTEADIQAVLSATDFVSNGAATFTVGSQTYLALNDGTAGFRATSDAIIEITSFTGNLSDLSII